MLYKIRSTTFYVRLKMVCKDIQRRLAREKDHPSNYRAGKSPHTEYLPIINNDLAIQEKCLRDEADKAGKLHPTVHIMIFSPDRRYVLMQRRSPVKSSSGNLMSQTVGGHIGFKAGTIGQRVTQEMALDALRAEVYQEAGIRLEGMPYSLLNIFPYRSEKIKQGKLAITHERVFLFIGEYEGGFTANLSEVKWMGWFSIKGIRKLAIKKPELFAPSFLKDLEEI